MCLTSPAEEMQEGRAGAGTEKADVGHRNHPRRTGVRRRMRMSFDINEPIFDGQGKYLEEPASRYEHALLEQFTASRRVTSDYPDGNRTGLGRSNDPLCHQLPWHDPTDDDHQRSRRSRLWPLPAASVITERGDGAEIIQELRTFWHFLERVYQLPQARQMQARLTPQAARRLERALQEPAN